METGTLLQELGTLRGFKRRSFDASLLPHSAPLSPRGAAALPRLRGAPLSGGTFSAWDPSPSPKLVNEDLVKGTRRSSPTQCQKGLHLGWDINTSPKPAFWGALGLALLQIPEASHTADPTSQF